MKKIENFGFSLIGVLLIIGALVVTTSGVLVWQKKISQVPTPSPVPTAPLSTPTPVPTFAPGITVSPKPTSVSKGGCIVWGCNGELCVDEDSERVDTICRQLPQHECFRTATCERQADRRCAWTQTEELMDCLNKFKISPSFTPTLGKECAVNGEAPTNFDMTTGEFIPGGKSCCEGLKAIGPRTPQDALDKGACMYKMGAVGVCRPCGDGICNPEYEDKCNCPEDCQ